MRPQVSLALIALLFAACGTIDEYQAARLGTASIVRLTREGEQQFRVAVRAERKRIVEEAKNKEEGQKALDRFFEKCEIARKVFTSIYAGSVTADFAIDEAEAKKAGKLAFEQTMLELLGHFGDLKTILTAFGVPIGGVAWKP